MKSLLFSLVILTFSYSSLRAQNSVFDGKITISDDATSPSNGTIRYNETLKKYEGYIDQQWVDLSFSCVCPYVLSPFDDATMYTNYTLTGSNQITMTVEFSHRMNPASFVYGTNVIVTGSGTTSANGTMVWDRNNTRLRITTNEAWNILSKSCFDPWSLEIIGTGNNPARGINGSPIDGDRDGCCGGNYSVRFGLLC